MIARPRLEPRHKILTVNFTSTTPRPISARPPIGSFLVDVTLVVGLALLALAIRLPHLLTVPRFTDEQLDVLYTLPLYRLEAFPLVAVDSYNGPLFSWLLAAFLWIVGPWPETPRLMVALIAVATVVLTYLLGRALGGRLAGLVAAGLIATCATHVVVNSHVAWSNGTTPFFTTLAILALLPAVRCGSGRQLALGGLAFGVALQTHPSVMTMFPGAGAAMLLQQRRLFLSRWTLLAGLLCILAYSPVLIANLVPASNLAYHQAVTDLVPNWLIRTNSLAAGLTQGQQTNADRQGGLAESFAQLSLNLPRVAASLIESRPAWTEYLQSPSFWIYGSLVLIGLLWPTRRGQPLLTLVGLSFLGLLAMTNNKYEPIFQGRYVMPVLPLAFAGFGWLVADLWRVVQGIVPRVVFAIGLVMLVLWPLVPLHAYLAREAANGQIDLDLIQSAATISGTRRPDELVLLDEALGRRGLPADGDLLQNLRVFLEFRDTPYRIGPITPRKIEGELAGARWAIVAVAQPYPRDLDEQFRFTPLEERTTGRYAIYRLERREGPS
jgi:4-amino-4-deoxy-L-arabinose transferase-like glycosyltransferase